MESAAENPLNASDPAELLGLCASLHDSSGTEIQKKINIYLQNQTGASAVFLVSILHKTEGVIQVIGNTVLEHELRFPVVNDVLNLAVKRRASVQSAPDQLNTDLREILKRIITPEPTSFLNIPVPEPVTKSIALLVCLVDYDEENKSDFVCTTLVLECFRYTFGVVRNTVMYEEEKRLKIQCQELLSVAKNLFSHLGDLGDLLREILMEARKLTNAERCSLFLVDPDHQELVAKVFDSESPKDTLPEVRIARTQGIAGHVATTGMLLNIRDAYSHPLFYKKIDELTGFRTRNILCFPIRDETQVIGVAELCNKKDGYHFDVFDEEVAMAFSVYCGISIMHSLVYKKIQDAQARNKLSNELMMYHMKVRDSDVQELLNNVPDHIDGLSDLEFSPRDVVYTLTPAFVYYMFRDLGQLDKFNIKPNIMARFILFVQKGYRDTPYHNWMHAFSTMHFAYMMLKRLELVKRGYFSELEALAYTVACLCHDLDHRGTTNSFQRQSGTILASLYCSDGSVMERHHFSQTLCILNSEGCNIVESLSQEDYTMFLDHVLDMILATDLAHHTDVVMARVKLHENILQGSEPKPHYLLSCLMMTLADLSDQTKNWRVVRSASELVYMEFFRQGDLEKAMGREPAEFMDRERANIPHLQIQFLDNIVFPLIQTIIKYFPELELLLKAAEENRRGWIIAQDFFTARWSQGHFSINILSDPQFEKQVLEKLNDHSSLGTVQEWL